jgi:hypothetical protein
MIRTSLFWKNYFTVNLQKQRVDWNVPSAITGDEKEKVLYSMKAWQLGETSDGRHLLAAASAYADKMKDAEYVNAVKFFIKEEQKHGSNLGKYIDRIGEQRLKKDWGDTIFRQIRYFNRSMELWTITVIIVESAAQIFYAALRDATQCSLLKSICNDILVDEAHHIKFQNERMFIIFREKPFYNRAVSLLFYSTLFFLTIHAIWFAHRKAFLAGNVSRKDFMREMYYKFFKCMQFLHSTQREHVASDVSLAVM